ncbi:unnamed protein product [Polarella glacialis]|uniref:TOG domain-containing protein n=1 Tax=Polarella glacialis TaxID=89957 RepID=A0A813J9Y4_POLGL|nr:unnamed protein product [Polarella glacialis]
MAPYALPCLLDWSRGSSNFGDEKLYIAILQEYSQQLLISVGTVEDTFKREDQAALREEVLRIQGSASYVAAERLRASAIALISALDSRSGQVPSRSQMRPGRSDPPFQAELPGLPQRRASGRELGRDRRGGVQSDNLLVFLSQRRGDSKDSASREHDLEARLPTGADGSSPSSRSCRQTAPRSSSAVPAGEERSPTAAEASLLSAISESRGQPRRPRNSKLISPDGAPLLCEFEELPPLDQPLSDRWLDDVFKRLASSSDWVCQFEALTDLRRIARFSPHSLSGSGQLRPAVSGVVEALESSRSSLSRAALVCLHDLLVAFRKQMDPELPLVLAACLRKAVDPNSFLAEEADKALQAMCHNVSEARGLAAVLAFMADARAKNPRARAKLTGCLVHFIQRMGPRIFRSADAERLAQLLAKLLSDAAGAVRQLAKEAMGCFRAAAPSQEEFERFLGKNLGSLEFQKVRQALEAATFEPSVPGGPGAEDGDMSPAGGRRRGDESPKRRSLLLRASK